MNLPLLLSAHWHLVSPLLVAALAWFICVVARVGWDAYMEERT